jgi:hypothetical protein
LLRSWRSFLERKISDSFSIVIILGIIGCFYLCCLPLHVQGGDTGELVASAYGLFVPHPPGYPLWTWLQTLWINIFSINTVFWRASLLSSLFALGTLWMISFSLRKTGLLLWLCLPLLALSTSFREAAVLPDVFSLHAFFIAAIGIVYF